MKVRRKVYFCNQMAENANPTKYLKAVTITLLIVYTLLVLMNFFEGIWDFDFHFGKGELYFLRHIKKYTNGFHFVLYVLLQILEIVFLLILNYFVKKYGIGKGYHFLIVLLSFVPVVNCLLFYIIKRKLNREFVIYSGIKVNRSDRKIVVAWVLMITFVIYAFIVPLVTYYSNSPEHVSGAAYFWRYSALITDAYFLVSSLIWLLYYLEFKRMLQKVSFRKSAVSENELLDDQVVITDL